jgi:uncharacterized protein
MAKRVNCPNCAAPVDWIAANRFRPFCSERCKQMDLGAWANDEYRIPSQTPPDVGEIEAGGTA